MKSLITFTLCEQENNSTFQKLFQGISFKKCNHVFREYIYIIMHSLFIIEIDVFHIFYF